MLFNYFRATIVFGQDFNQLKYLNNKKRPSTTNSMTFEVYTHAIIGLPYHDV